ncbi:MAG TPA: DUF177 domain-containing protein [Smithellaceae bacterium]|nr:DUF177 domain-containing protein [Smithellaceae bacterium]
MPDSLKINVVTIPEQGLHLCLTESGSWFKDLLPDEGETNFTLREMTADCLISKAGSDIIIRGKIAAILDICCSRCLENVSLPLNSDFSYTLVPFRLETEEELELSADDLEISYYRGDIIDLEPLLYEQIILQIPIKALCSEECRGLCPRCGINLNNASCSCHAEFIDERLAVLKNFKLKN